ncbi:MAG: hypothetical protein HXS46_20665 [Theionarchaea archaeon]|nr:MAG: hypothetical protein AYK18_08890 [Theionarchaea archaeon DG-70]MBU7013101.1 hypothetical protein [Theionarchaea archaeon]
MKKKMLIVVVSGALLLLAASCVTASSDEPCAPVSVYQTEEAGSDENCSDTANTVCDAPIGGLTYRQKDTTLDKGEPSNGGNYGVGVEGGPPGTPG